MKIFLLIISMLLILAIEVVEAIEVFAPARLSAQQRSPYSRKNNASGQQPQYAADTSQRQGNTEKELELAKVETEDKLSDKNSFSLDLQIGYIYGEVRELLMASSDNYDKVDRQLTWKMQDTLTMSASFAAILKQTYFRLGASLPLILTKAPMEELGWRFDQQSGRMSDYSGFASQYSLSDTENELSFSAYGIGAVNLFKGFNAPRLELGLSVLYMTWGWRALKTRGLSLASDGSFEVVAPSPASGDTVRYRVHHLAAAISSRFSFKWRIYGMEVLLNYSPSAIFFDRDKHIVTGVSSNGFGFLGQMFWGTVTNRFWITDNLSMNFGIRGKVLLRTRIGSLVQKNNNGEKTTRSNAAGSEYFDMEVFAGLTLRF